MTERPREQAAAFRNLPYVQRDGRQLLMDIYRPEGDAAVPVAVYLHPGGWRSGSKDVCLVRWLVRYGIAVASIDYRLLPRHRFPAALLDAKAAVRFIAARAGDYGWPRGQWRRWGCRRGRTWRTCWG